LLSNPLILTDAKTLISPERELVKIEPLLKVNPDRLNIPELTTSLPLFIVRAPVREPELLNEAPEELSVIFPEIVPELLISAPLFDVTFPVWLPKTFKILPLPKIKAVELLPYTLMVMGLPIF
jgi:hypothetical protein